MRARILSCLLTVVVLAQCTTPLPDPPPQAPVDEVVETYWGVEVVDPQPFEGAECYSIFKVKYDKVIAI